MSDVWYEIVSPCVQKPYYFNVNSKIAAWNVPYNTRIYNPPDGFYIDPPKNSFFGIETSKKGIKIQNSNFSSANSKLSRECEIISCNNALDSSDRAIRSEKFNDVGILNLHSGISNDIAEKHSYFPGDIMVLYSREQILEFLRENTNVELKKKSNKDSLSFEKIIHPGKTFISQPLLNMRVPFPKKSCISLFKCIYNYITTKSVEHLVEIDQIIQLVDGISDEYIYQLLFEINSIKPVGTIIVAWRLFLYSITKYNFSTQIRTLLRSFCYVASTSDDVPREIKDFATLSFLRLTQSNPLTYKILPTDLNQQVDFCCSLNVLFGFSVQETLWKESIRKHKHHNNVPNIVRKLAVKVRDLGGFALGMLDNIYNTRVNANEVYKVMGKINGGEWEAETDNSALVFVVLVEYFKCLRDPIIDTKTLFKLAPDIQSNECIKVVNDLENGNRETLMYFIGFLQEMLFYNSKKLLSFQNYSMNLKSTLCSQLPEILENETVESSPQQKILLKIFTSILQFWRTDEVYFSLNKLQ